MALKKLSVQLMALGEAYDALVVLTNRVRRGWTSVTGGIRNASTGDMLLTDDDSLPPSSVPISPSDSLSINYSIAIRNLSAMLGKLKGDEEIFAAAPFIAVDGVCDMHQLPIALTVPAKKCMTSVISLISLVDNIRELITLILTSLARPTGPDQRCKLWMEIQSVACKALLM